MTKPAVFKTVCYFVTWGNYDILAAINRLNLLIPVMPIYDPKSGILERGFAKGPLRMSIIFLISHIK